MNRISCMAETSFELEQFIAFAKILARVVLPVPLVPENIKA